MAAFLKMEWRTATLPDLSSQRVQEGHRCHRKNYGHSFLACTSISIVFSVKAKEKIRLQIVAGGCAVADSIFIFFFQLSALLSQEFNSGLWFS
jgi:hypothetical protein